MKDNLRSENEEYVSNDTSCKATLWEWVVWNERFKKLKKNKKIKNKKIKKINKIFFFGII